jgi:cyclopropane-fatty-acyl-phospholipid synthase
MTPTATTALSRSPLAVADPSPAPAATPRDRAGKAAVTWILRHLAHGQITLIERGRARTYGAATPAFPLRATIVVHSPRFYGSLLSGSAGAGASYMDGDWDTDDLTALVRICARNLQGYDGYRRRAGPVLGPVRNTVGWLQRNTPTRSRERISAHYDLGNDFFEQFLDPTMMYSCAVFDRPELSLHEAQVAKVERICAKLDLGPGDHLLEIGTGWGWLAVYAAQTYGCRVTTTTISREQHERATARVRDAGLADRVEVLLCDYRDLTGTYDKLVSVEMIEAVGWEYFDRFFEVCSGLLRPDGLMCLQSITIDERIFEHAKASDDFIKAFIFPGGCIPSVGAITDSIGRATDLRAVQLEDITASYAQTLRHWRDNLYANLGEIRAAGYDDPRFLRMWEMYLCFCEGGFAERRIGDVQLLLAKPLYRDEPLGELRGRGTPSGGEALGGARVA